MENLDILGIDNIRSIICGDVRTRARADAEVLWRVPGEPGKDDCRTLTGYPAVFSQWTTLYAGKSFIVREQLAPGFFDDVLGDDCHLNYVHESPSAMARNKPHMPLDQQDGPGSMELSVDAHGLRTFALLPLDDLDVQRMEPKMRRGVVNQMSFAFSVSDEECLQYEDDEGHTVYDYTLKKCARLYDICVCPLGAYSQTEAMLRSVLNAQAGGRSLEGRPTDEGRSQEGSQGVDGVASPEGPEDRARRIRECEMRAAELRFRPKV